QDVVHRPPTDGILPLTGIFFPAEVSRTTSFYEGTTADVNQRVKQTSNERDFDDTGNLTSFIDRGEPGSDDDALYRLSWRRDAATHIMRLEPLIGRDGQGTLLRQRDTSYRADGTVDTLADAVVGGKDPSGAPFTGSADRNLTRRFTYDNVGNLTAVIEPS